MGKIVSSKTLNNNDVLFEIEVNYQESLFLKGNIQNIHLFSEDAAEVCTNIASRGAYESTKYFLIPKSLRGGFDFNRDVRCQRIDLDNKIIFVFLVE